ncbi:hypothetical protein P200_gp032 [Pelagibacter phage HTVC200P]|nr:hypothetical protein P200_gp032 [Pelagibacter phage HTVC200P]
MAIKYQSGFIGSQTVSPNSETRALIDGLNTFAKGFNTFAVAKGKKITEQTTAEAEKAARLDNLKSYQDGVDSGELDGTQSEFWISVYDNIKGQNAGVEFKTKKALAYNEWWAENAENDDLDGSLYSAWSNDFDKQYIEANKNQSSFFLKGLDGFIRGTNQQMAGMYASSNAEKLKIKGKNNLISALEGVIGTDEVNAKIDELDVKTNVSRFLSKDEFNDAVITAYKNKIAKLAVKGDPSADYDAAEALVDELLAFERSNGSKIVSGSNIEVLNNLKQTLITEELQHQVAMKKVSDNVIAQDWYTQEERTLTKKLGYDFATGTGSTEALEKANLAKDEYNKRVKAWMSLNNDLPIEAQKAYFTELRQDIVNKYEDFDIESISMYNARSNKFNINRDIAELQSAIALYDQDPTDARLMEDYGVIAKLNGYVDEKGNVTTKTLGDLLVDLDKLFTGSN